MAELRLPRHLAVALDGLFKNKSNYSHTFFCDCGGNLFFAWTETNHVTSSFMGDSRNVQMVRTERTQVGVRRWRLVHKEGSLLWFFNISS